MHDVFGTFPTSEVVINIFSAFIYSIKCYIPDQHHMNANIIVWFGYRLEHLSEVGGLHSQLLVPLV